MSRLDKDQGNEIYEPPMLFGLGSVDDYLVELYGAINKKIKEVEKSRPVSFSNEEEWMLDGNIDEHIIELGSINQILIESSLVAYYSYFEGQMRSICEGLSPNSQKSSNGFLRLVCHFIPIRNKKKILRGKNDLDTYRIKICKALSLAETESMKNSWQQIIKFNLMRNYIVHSNITPKKERNLLQEAKTNKLIWFNKKTNEFSISIDYVKSFSRTISSYLTELDYLVYQKTGKNTLI